jgi:hypothetical protein
MIEIKGLWCQLYFKTYAKLSTDVSAINVSYIGELQILNYQTRTSEHSGPCDS